MKIMRRDIGKAVAGAAAIAAFNPLQSRAAMATDAKSSVQQSVYSGKLGDLTVISAIDGTVSRELDEGFVANAPFEDVQAVLENAFLPTDSVTIPFTPLSVISGSDTILIDTGFADNGPPTTGFFRQNLKAAGVTPENVTKIIISHFHPDHIHGLKTKDGQDIYPNAEILVPAAEWDFWTSETNKANAGGAAGLFDLAAAKFSGLEDRVTPYNWDQELVPGITAVDAHGHTPGHTVFALHSGDEKMLLLMDAANHTELFVRNPDWGIMFDMDKEQAAKTRRRLLEMAASERMQIAGYHFPFPARGYVKQAGNGFEFVPAFWNPNL